MKKYIFPVLFICILLFVACANESPTAEPTEVVAVVEEETAVSPNPAPTISPTSTLVPSATPSHTPIPTNAPTETATMTPTPAPTVTPPLMQIVLPSETEDSEESGLEIVNQIGGAVTAVAVQDNLAYLGIGSRFAVIDIADPTQLKIINKSDVLPSIIRQIVIKDNLAYLALGEEGLWVFNIDNPTTLEFVGSIKTNTSVDHILVEDDLAYAISKRYVGELPQTEGQALVIFEIEDPSQLEEIGTLPLPTQAKKLALINNVLYVDIYPAHANFESTLFVVDVADPTTPTLITAVPELASSDIVIKDDQLILSERGTLVLADITNPINPTKVMQSTHLIDYDDMQFLHLDQDIIWSASLFGDVTGCAGNLYAFDIADIDNIQTVSKIRVSCEINDVTTSDNKLYLATNDGLDILDITVPMTPAYIGELSTIPPLQQLAVGNDIYGLTELGYKVFIFDLDNPIELHKNNLYSGHDFINSMGVYDTYLYLGTSLSDRAPVLDVSVPSHATEIGVIEPSYLPISFSNLIFSNGYLYMLMDVSTSVFDASDPANPKQLNSDDEATMRDNQSFVIEGNTMYAWVQTTTDHGFRVIDISNPEALKEIGFLKDELEMYLYAMVASQEYVYLVGDICVYRSECEDQTILRIVDITDPANLAMIVALPISVEIKDVALFGDLLILTGDDLWVVDVTDPMRPQIIGQFETPGNSVDSVIANDLIYVADGAGGVLVLRMDESLQP